MLVYFAVKAAVALPIEALLDRGLCLVDDMCLMQMFGKSTSMTRHLAELGWQYIS